MNENVLSAPFPQSGGAGRSENEMPFVPGPCVFGLPCGCGQGSGDWIFLRPGGVFALLQTRFGPLRIPGGENKRMEHTKLASTRWLESQNALTKGVAVLFGSLLLTAGSYITVPMVPVPMTMQTFAVMVIGALFGWRLGGLTVACWLLQGALGLPVFAPGAAGGIARFFGPTGGYLLSFPLAAMMTGWLVSRGWDGSRFIKGFAAMLAGNLFVLAFGGLWLAALIGLEKGMALGVTPFISGAVTKSVLGAAVLLAVSARRFDRR